MSANDPYVFADFRRKSRLQEIRPTPIRWQVRQREDAARLSQRTAFASFLRREFMAAQKSA
jgi:hypothetical protein